MNLLLRVNKYLLECLRLLLDEALRMLLYVLRVVTVARRDYINQVFYLIFSKFRMRSPCLHMYWHLRTHLLQGLQILYFTLMEVRFCTSRVQASI